MSTPARTYLFVPGDRPDRFDKAAAAGADLVLLDLEDAVTPQAKAAARDHVAAWLRQGRPAGVRINGVGTPWHDDDVRALAVLPGLAAVVLPMAQDSAAVERIHRTCDVPVIPLIETALGLTRAAELAAADGVSRLAFGHLDFASDIDADPVDTAMHHARSVIVVASRVAGLPGPVAGVTTDLDDDAITQADARRDRSMGFTGKLCIHPRQIPAVHGAFGPTPEQIEWARRVLPAAQESGVGAVRVDGQMVDEPVLARARAVLAHEESTT